SAVIDGGQATFKSQTTRLAAPQTQFSLNTEKLDLNRWLPAPAAAQPPEAASGQASQQAAQPAAATPDNPTPAPSPAPTPTPVDLSFLKDLDVQGDVKIGDLRVRDVQLTDFNAQTRIQQGTLDISKLQAALYEGTLTGQFSATADQAFGLKLNLDKVSVAPLIQALLGRGLMSGQGKAQIDLHAQGATPDALAQSLAGRMSLQVRDGTVQGVDASRTLADVSAALGNVLKGRLDALASPFDSRRNTAFSSLDGVLDLKDGQGTLTKLSLVSDLVRVSAGQPARIDVPGRRLDVMLKAQAAARLPKGLKLDMGSLLGVTIPI